MTAQREDGGTKSLHAAPHRPAVIQGASVLAEATVDPEAAADGVGIRRAVWSSCSISGG